MCILYMSMRMRQQTVASGLLLTLSLTRFRDIFGFQMLLKHLSNISDKALKINTERVIHNLSRNPLHLVCQNAGFLQAGNAEYAIVRRWRRTKLTAVPRSDVLALYLLGFNLECPLMQRGLADWSRTFLGLLQLEASNAAELPIGGAALMQR
jgi:hypothetical protein